MDRTKSGTQPPIVFISPSKFVQGPGVLDDLGTYVKPLGSRVLLVTDQYVWNHLEERAQRGCEGSNLQLTPHLFSGECSLNQIDLASSKASDEQCDVIMSLGGGKAHDVAKAVGARLGCRWATGVTIASTDSPTSSLSVIYTDSGEMVNYIEHGKNPDLVLVDSDIVAHAPARFLAAGMADAVATRWESRAAAASGTITLAGGRPSRAALSLGALAWDNCRKYGMAAIRSVEAQTVSPALELIIETNTLHSGLGFESGGFSGAHAVHNGLTAVPEAHVAMHGEKVSFGIVVQLMLETAPDAEVDEYIDFARALGLPVTLSEVGLDDPSDEVIRTIASRAAAPDESIHWLPFPVNAEMLAGAIRGADAYARARARLSGVGAGAWTTRDTVSPSGQRLGDRRSF